MSATRFLSIPTDIAESHRLKAEATRQRKARFDAGRTDKAHGKTHIPASQRPFVVWDGEGPQDTGYSLLGNSEGMEICYPHLRTKHCLQLLIESAQLHPEAINVGFGFNYDVSCMLWELSWRHLNALYKFNRTVWRDYKIEHVPGKWFQVSHGNTTIRIYDVRSFFASSLITALETWKVGPFSKKSKKFHTPLPEWYRADSNSVPTVGQLSALSESQTIRIFKNLRSEFRYKDIQSIAVYMRLELKYTKELMELVREAFANADYIPRSWHGPGAVARMAFKRHGIFDVLTQCPVPVAQAARYAFVAGRFELVMAGHVGRVYTADINSAYPYFCSQLPNLSRGHWRKTNRYEDGKFAIYRIRYSAKPDGYRIYPLPFRDKNRMIVWPHRVTGWYWNPEAALVANDPDAEFLDGWVFDEFDESDRPFSWIVDYYNRRRKLKDDGNPAEYTFKLIINSIYGQLAQRTGWDKKRRRPPKTHQLEYAGWITSSCRAMVYNLARECGNDLVSIDTDGVTSRTPFTSVKHSKVLGGWELAEFDDSIFWQSGIYMLKEGTCPIKSDCSLQWTKARTRGIPKGSYTVNDLLVAMDKGESLKLTKKVFIGYGLALAMRRLNKMNRWENEPHEYKFGGAGKRYHDTGSDYRRGSCVCRTDATSKIHRLRLPTVFYSPSFDTTSHAHQLPWLTSSKEYAGKQYLNDLTLYDANDLDLEEEWVTGYVGNESTNLPL